MRFTINSLSWVMLIVLIGISGCSKTNEEPPNPTNGKTKAVFNSNLGYGTLTDQDGNEYKTITIGTQTWMAENLRTTKYRNGKDMKYAYTSSVWARWEGGAYCTNKHTIIADSIATYGRLYNWDAVADECKIAPEGWHVPTVAEWKILIDYLVVNGYSYNGFTDLRYDDIGKALASTYGWEWSKYPASIGNPAFSEKRNASGFTALPGGALRYYLNGFENFGTSGTWWSIDEFEEWEGYSYCFYLKYNGFGLIESWAQHGAGFSVRCIKNK